MRVLGWAWGRGGHRYWFHCERASSRLILRADLPTHPCHLLFPQMLVTHQPSYALKNGPSSELSVRLLSACCVPGTVPRAGRSSENNADPVSALGARTARRQGLLPHRRYVRQVTPCGPEHCLPTRSTFDGTGAVETARPTRFCAEDPLVGD